MLPLLLAAVATIGQGTPEAQKPMTDSIRWMSAKQALFATGPIVVEVVADEVPGGPQARTLKTAIELKLRTIGIDVREDNSANVSVPFSVLTLSLDIMELSDRPQYIYTITLALKRFSLLIAETPSREHGGMMMAPVWQTGSFGIVGSQKLGGLRESVDNALAEFMNDYLAVNPKR